MQLSQLEQLFFRTVRQWEPPAGLAEIFVDRAPLDAARRMGIYHHAYYARQLEVLRQVYPRTCQGLGPTAFREAALRFLDAHPSVNPVIEWVAQRFPNFLAKGEHGSRTVWVDLARIEWASTHALLAPDSGEPLERSQLERLDPSNDRLPPSPALTLLRVRREALLHFEGKTPSAADARLGFVVVNRARRGIVHGALSEPAGRALERSLRGEPLANVCCEFTGENSVAAAHAALLEFLRLEVWCRPAGSEDYV